MSVTPSQPTILVKKSDGTTVRMTLAELAASKKPIEQVVTASPASSLPPVPQIQTPATPLVEETIEEELLDADALPGADDHHIAVVQEIVPSLTPEPVEQEEYLSADALRGATDSHQEEQAASSHSLEVETPHALAATTPVADIFVDKAAFAAHTTTPQTDRIGLSTPTNTENMVVWEKDDHTSLLEDSLDEPLPHKASGDDTRVQVEQVMSRLSTPLSVEDQKTVRGLVLSRIKDVRTDEQLFSSITREKNTGGLGLSKEVGDEVVRIISDMREGDMGVMPVAPVRTPVMQKTAPVTPRQSIPAVPSVEASKIPPRALPTPVSGVRQSSGNKQVVQDITPPPKRQPVIPAMPPLGETPKENVGGITQKRTVGPVDEFQQMTLVSFRQLAPTAEESVDVLIRHITVLQEESYLLFLESKDAWKQSELALRYQQVLIGALKEGITIPAYLARHSDTLTPEEFSALVRFSSVIS